VAADNRLVGGSSPLSPTTQSCANGDFPVQCESLLVLNGALSIVFGVILFVQPGAGAVALVWMIGWFAVVLGCLYIALAFRLKSSTSYSLPTRELSAARIDGATARTGSKDKRPSSGNPHPASYQQSLSAPALALFFLIRTGAATNGRLSFYYSARGFSLA
jgi:hypothetical protein